MGKIYENKGLAIKIAALLKDTGHDVDVSHDEYGTRVEIDNVEFTFDTDGKMEDMTIAL